MNREEIIKLIEESEHSNDAAFRLFHELNIKVEPFEDYFTYAWIIVGDHGQHVIEHKVPGNETDTTRKAIANVASDYLDWIEKESANG